MADRVRELVRQAPVEPRRLASPARPVLATPVGEVALDDPVTVAGIAAQRRRARRPMGWSLAVLGTGAAGVAAAVSLQQEQAGSLFGLVAFLGGFAVLVTVLAHPLRRRLARRARRVLGRSPWRMVEAVRLPGKGPAGPMVVVLHPQTGQPAGTWILEESWLAGWPVPGERSWVLLAIDTDRRRAMLGSPDRTALASLQASAPLGTDGDPHAWAWSEAAQRWDLGPPSSAGIAWRSPVVEDLGPTPASAVRDQRRFTTRQWGAAAVAVALLAVIASGLGWHGRLGDERADRSVRRDGERASALVREVERGRDTRDVYLMLETGPYAGSLAQVAVAQHADVGAGDVVTVAYSPDRPEDIVILGEAAPPSGVFLPMVLWAVAVALTCRATRDQRNAGVAPPPLDASSGRIALLASPLGLTRLREGAGAPGIRETARAPGARRRLYAWRRVPSMALASGTLVMSWTAGRSPIGLVILGTVVIACLADWLWLRVQLAPSTPSRR